MDHYLQITVEIGPLEQPHKLHVITPEGDVEETQHGRLALQVQDAVSAVVPDADMSAQIVSAAELGYEES